MIFEIKQNDREPPLDYVFTDADGQPVDLTGKAVVFIMAPEPGGTVKVNRQAATITDATNGLVQYPWGATDTDTSGRYLAEFEATGSGKKQSSPVDGYIHVVVIPELA